MILGKIVYEMYQPLIILTYILTSIGYIIEIYHLLKYGEDKHTNICLWTANGGACIFAFVYCFENGYKDLMVLFILHYAFCFICISLNLYNALTKKGMTTYIIQEKTPQLEDTYPSKSGSFEIEMKPIRMMSNPIHKKNVP